MKQKIKALIKKILQFIMNPRLLLCLGIAWMITNGWSYVLFALGTILKIHWMIVVAGGYMAFLWLPVSPEKLATIAIAILLLNRLFPDDEKTLGTLKNMKKKLKTKVQIRLAAKKKAKSIEHSIDQQDEQATDQQDEQATDLQDEKNTERQGEKT